MDKTVLFLVIVAFGINWAFFMGWIGLENAWNMRTVENAYGGVWCDMDMFKTTCTQPAEQYLMSVNLMAFSFCAITVLCLSFTYKTIKIERDRKPYRYHYKP